MKKENLCVGDYVIVSQTNKNAVVLAIGSGDILIRYTSGGDVDALDCSELKPIQLDEEKLYRFDFNYNSVSSKFFPDTFQKGNLILEQKSDGYRIMTICSYDDKCLDETPFILKYLHQLQHVLSFIDEN